ncbi:hypothetical protein J6590_034789 [Homalodisca vitripennis]|nr:hypothetical protein J6590_034789 [Homalodisca vitripennis]
MGSLVTRGCCPRDAGTELENSSSSWNFDRKRLNKGVPPPAFFDWLVQSWPALLPGRHDLEPFLASKLTLGEVSDGVEAPVAVYSQDFSQWYEQASGLEDESNAEVINPRTLKASVEEMLLKFGFEIELSTVYLIYVFSSMVLEIQKPTNRRHKWRGVDRKTLTFFHSVLGTELRCSGVEIELVF